jgi:hypothetical protein
MEVSVNSPQASIVFQDIVTKAYWTGPILDAEMLANSKVARQINSKAHNPTYTSEECIGATVYLCQYSFTFYGERV